MCFVHSQRDSASFCHSDRNVTKLHISLTPKKCAIICGIIFQALTSVYSDFG